VRAGREYGGRLRCRWWRWKKECWPTACGCFAGALLEELRPATLDEGGEGDIACFGMDAAVYMGSALGGCGVESEGLCDDGVEFVLALALCERSLWGSWEIKDEIAVGWV
jgi:hypothetical protein